LRCSSSSRLAARLLGDVGAAADHRETATARSSSAATVGSRVGP
jgi:hypothetical protein